MFSNWADTAKSSMTQALEKTGDALSKAATNAGKNARVNGDESSSSAASASLASQPTDVPVAQAGGVPPSNKSVQAATDGSGDEAKQEKQFFSNISQGWSNVVQNTKASMKQAEEKMKEQQAVLQEKMKEQQASLQERMSKVRSAYYKRDPSLPLDVDALRDAEVVYITDRLITMGHPAMASQYDGDITGERKLAAVGHLLNRRHDGRYMVWNLSEIFYDVDVLDDQVLTFSFPGSPSPPLGLLLKLLVSMESWLKADDRNVAVVHCLTGKGRTSTVLAAFLCWMGQAKFSDIYEALAYIAGCKQITPYELTIPSQRRYASYFKNMLDGVRPSQTPLMLKRIIMSEAPRYAKGPPLSEEHSRFGEDGRLGCVPYLQIFKAGKLLHTAPASLHFQQAENELPFCQVAHESISFNIGLVVQGDILVRARHLTSTKMRVSMFRAAFHTGYAPPNVMRMTKVQLDGACDDDRFMSDFFLDFIFEPVDAAEASKLLAIEETAEKASSSAEESKQNAEKRASAVRASDEDTMLHRDSRFWEVIATRMKEQAADSTESSDDPMWGPTVGRRRDFEKDKTNKTEEKEAKETTEQRTDLETFSIGGEFDFLPEMIEGEAAQQPLSPTVPDKPPVDPKKDSLMEALMGALDDNDEREEEEVVVFGSDDSETTKPSSLENIKDEKGGEPLNPVSTTTEGAAEVVDTTTASLSGVQSLTSEFASKQSSVDDMEKLLADANIDLDDDMDALLAGAGDGLSDDDLLNLDIDDAELDDLESFLTPTNK